MSPHLVSLSCFRFVDVDAISTKWFGNLKVPYFPVILSRRTLLNWIFLLSQAIFCLTYLERYTVSWHLNQSVPDIPLFR